MNKFFKLYILLLMLPSFLFCQLTIKKMNSSSNKFLLGGNESYDIKSQLANGELPVTNTFYQLNDGDDIEVNFIFSSQNSEIINYDNMQKFSNSIYTASSDNIFPNNNLIVSDPMVFRGVVVRQITFIPFTYNMDTKELITFNDVEFNVEEVPSSMLLDYNNIKLSKSFEPLYEDLIINYERSSREEDYQAPSILYICGGSSLNNPYVQDLLEWRHKTGYIVNAVSTNEIGGSGTVSVKNYIQSAYDNWDNPPEIVGLIGDTGGSYSIGYYTEGWSGYNGAGDFPYCQLDGSDLLPEVFIGRISVNSSSELSNVLNKTLAYEKAT